MVIEYDKDYLRELYEDGKCKNKKHRFDTSVIKKYQKRISYKEKWKKNHLIQLSFQKCKKKIN